MLVADIDHNGVQETAAVSVACVNVFGERSVPSGQAAAAGLAGENASS